MSGRSVAVLAIAIALAAGGCSTADLKQPITAFNTATKASQASLTAYEEIIDTAAYEANVAYALKNASVLRVAENECDPGKARCRLIIRDRSGGVRPLGPEPVDPNIRRLMAGLVTYAGNLETIVNVDSESEIKTAADTTKANLTALAKAADDLARSGGKADSNIQASVTSFATPVADGIVWVLGKYVEALKREALREATTAMDRIMPDLATLFGEVARSGLTNKRNNLAVAFGNAELAYNAEKPTRTNLDALARAAIAYDAALQIDPRTMFTTLVAAHHELAQALESPTLNFDTLWPLIASIAAEAAKVQAIAAAASTAFSSAQ